MVIIANKGALPGVTMHMGINNTSGGIGLINESKKVINIKPHMPYSFKISNIDSNKFIITSLIIYNKQNTIKIL
ncbi:MAG: hypothetical protein K9L17_06370 [Clostridiales bacterium]|nr:hypothetical protein [Clostridiales bacterium]